MNALTGLERGFGWILQTTWQAAVVAVIILLAQFVLRNRLSPAWRHGLWFLLVARLMMPMTPSSAVSVFNLAKWSGRQDAPVSVMAPSAEGLVVPFPAGIARPDGAAVQPVAPSPTRAGRISEPRLISSFQSESAIPTARPMAHRMNWMGLAALAWLAGVLLLALRFFCLERRFGSRLAGSKLASDGSIGQLFKECSRSLRVQEKVEIRETEEVESPAVHGFWRKRLLLPVGLRGQLSGEELRNVFLHELAHIKRRDPELNWLLVILQILHWFNPVLWFAFARIRVDRELATDDLALTQTRDRGCYGETILKVLEGLTQRPALPGLVGIAESKAQMRERFRAISRFGAFPRWRWAAGTAAVMIAGMTLTNARQEGKNNGINLLSRYPTSLAAGDAVPGRARPWQFTPEDIFQVSHFILEIGKQFHVESGAADLGIGHCTDGAVWAVLLPREGGKLTSTATTNQESITNVWLRFHPAQINLIFPSETVTGVGSADLAERIRGVANAKFYSSWHAGNNAMIPEPKNMTVDADTKEGSRRFFIVDRDAQTAEYVGSFARQSSRTAEPVYEPEVDTNCARVVSVAPPNGASGVEPIQDLRIVFDRPMNPYYAKLAWLGGGFQLNGSIQVGADHKEFIIPVRMTPGQEQKLVVNRDNDREMWVATGSRPEMKASFTSRPREGFLDANAVAANEFRWSFSTKADGVKPGAGKPRVLSVSPASGGTAPVLTFVEITFDQPMRSPDAQFPYLQKRPFAEGASIIPSFDYDASAHRFAFPVLLPPDNDARLTLEGFYSADGVACDPVVLHYQTGPDSLDSKYKEKAKSAAKDPRLEKLMTSMKASRARLNSGIVTVQNIDLRLEKNSFCAIEAKTATFKWQGPDQVYADVSGPMGMTRAFILGSDGQTCWLYSENTKGEKRLDQTSAAKTEREISLLDPFDLSKRSVAEALADRALVVASDAKLEGRTCYRIESWNVSRENMVFAMQTQWWIDEETFLPKQIVQHHPSGCQIVRFDYKDLNQRIPDSAFQPPAAPGGDAHPLFFQKEPGPGEQRFLRISDGSNGRMSGRLGWHGPNGTTSSGLN